MALYQVYNPKWWKGRIDGSSKDHLRWHQVIEGLDMEKTGLKGFAFLGFECDEGVRRNHGRTGAKEGPEFIQNALSNLPVGSLPSLYDAGNVLCDNEDLEAAQKLLGINVARILQTGCFPVVLGGGHEVAYGHYSGLAEALPGSRIGIINIDAHFDLRQPQKGKASSGTPFFQIHQHCKKNSMPFEYLVFGIQQHSNTPVLFNFADAAGVQYFFDKEIHPMRLPELEQAVYELAEKVDHIYLTVCMDAFNVAHAPGVSAINAAGLSPDPTVHELLKCIAGTGKLTSLDIAEVNPSLDIDNRTSKLAAWLIYEVVNVLSKK